MLESVAGGELKVPTLFFPDGSVLVQPSLQQVAEKAGLRTRPELPFYDVIIIGSGPGGCRRRCTPAPTA